MQRVRLPAPVSKTHLGTHEQAPGMRLDLPIGAVVRSDPTVCLPMSVADHLRNKRRGAQPDSLFEQVGGRPTLDGVHRIFYDKIYGDPWLSQYFDGVEQEMIEVHQSDFMTGPMGGGHIFCGRPPKFAHSHIEVSRELFDRRHRFLAEALEEYGVEPVSREAWLRIDEAFRFAILRSKEACVPRTDTISTTVTGVLSIPKPAGLDQQEAA